MQIAIVKLQFKRHNITELKLNTNIELLTRQVIIVQSSNECIYFTIMMMSALFMFVSGNTFSSRKNTLIINFDRGF